jgi:WD40 repeat protein
LVHEITLDDGAWSTALSPDGRSLAIGGWDHPSVVVVDLASGREHRLGGFDWPRVFEVSWSPNGRWIAATGDDYARVWDAATGTQRAVLRGHTAFTFGLDWSADSTRIATGSSDGTARVWDRIDDGGKEVMALSGSGTHNGIIGVAFSPDGRRLLVGGDKNTAATIFDVGLTGNAEWATVSAPLAYTGVDFFPDGHRFVASSAGVSATIWDSHTGRSIGATGTHGPSDDPATGTHVYQVDISPDGVLIATASDKSVKVWEAETRKEVFAYAPGGSVNDVAWSPDGALLAVVEFDNRVTTILDQTGRTIGQVREADGSLPMSAAFSADGAWLATSRVQDAVRIGKTGVTVWDWRTGEAVKTMDTLAESLAFAPVGTLLATAERAGPARIWDARTGRPLTTLTGHTSGVDDVAFSPDGATVATAGEDGTVRLWDADSGIQRLVLRGHIGVAGTVRFSPDGTKLASTGTDGVVRVWALDIDDLLRIAGENVTRGLTPAECLQYLHVDSCA